MLVGKALIICHFTHLDIHTQKINKFSFAQIKKEIRLVVCSPKIAGVQLERKALVNPKWSNGLMFNVLARALGNLHRPRHGPRCWIHP